MNQSQSKVLASVASQVAALELSVENSAVEEAEADIQACQTKLDEAEARIADLAVKIQEYDGPDADSVADALLADASPEQAAVHGTTKDELIAERDSLRAGTGALRARMSEKRRQISEIRQAVANQVGELVRPYVEEVERTQRLAAEQLVEAFVAIKMLNGFTRKFVLEELRSRHAVKGMMGTDEVLPWMNQASVPAPLISALAPLTKKGPACAFRSSEQVSLN